jgi:hypothetical protein
LVEAPFTVLPTRGVIEGNGSVQLTLTFSPPEARSYASKLEVTCSSGEQSFGVQVSGSAASADVHLDTSLAALGATYITLTSQNKVLLHNRGDVPVRFSWKVREWRCCEVVEGRGSEERERERERE